MKGQVYRVIAGFYDVCYKDTIFQVRGSGNLRNLEKNPVVGDFVEFEKDKFITNIYPCKNKLIRPKVANIDQIAIVNSILEPNYSALLLNRFLAIIEFQNIKPIIIFSKIDLSNKSYKQEYVKDGYEVYEINCLNKNEIKKIKKTFENKLTVFTGKTGVGKSTIIQNMIDIKRETQKISKALGQGKHTTRVTEILTKNQIRVIDTPGFSALEIKLTKLELAVSYQDFKKNAIYCQFKNCLHNKEQKCKIKDMVNNKKISVIRYNNYLKILKEIQNG